MSNLFLLLKDISNQTDTNNSTDYLPTYGGFLLLGGSSFFLGSLFLPIKSFESGDGMFFQFIFCIGVWTVGLVVNIFRNFPKFYALPMLSGLIWTTGNINTVAIIKTIGMSIGVLIWGGVSLVLSWATTRFGWFGLRANIPSNVTLNYVAVAIIFVATIFYFFVKPVTQNSNFGSNNKIQNLNEISNDEWSRMNFEDEVQNSSKSLNDKSFLNKLNSKQNHFLGIFLAIFAGLCYSQCNTPILYVIANYSNASQNMLDYLFSYHTGVLFTSLTYFIIYCIFKKNKPNVYPQIILPGLIAGCMLGIGSLLFFLALNSLSSAISFPLIAAGPSVVSNLWAIILYKEIKGIRNYVILFTGFGFALAGSILCGLSF